MSSAMNLKNSFHMKYDKKLLDRELVLTRKISVSAMIVLRTSKLLQYLFLWHWRDKLDVSLSMYGTSIFCTLNKLARF